MTLTLKFLGGVGTVTGSKHLLRGPGISVLVDCGLFQGFKQLRLRNRAPFPVRPQEIETVVLTHAHLDHSGYIPLLVKNGFGGQVLCTPATHDLCKILLRDSGHILEKDAEFANRHGFSKHNPALPLYTQADAEASLERFSDVPFNTKHRLKKIGVSGGDKLDHGSGGFSFRGRSKTLPPVAFDPFVDGRWEDVHRGCLFAGSACVSF